MATRDQAFKMMRELLWNLLEDVQAAKGSDDLEVRQSAEIRERQILEALNAAEHVDKPN